MLLLAIDGNSILNRAFYGIKPLTNKKGFYTNAILGFMNIYLKTLKETSPDEVAVAFDVKAPTFRHKKASFYKANRKGMPPELAEQLPAVKQILGEMGIPVIECPGFEADDILGTIAAGASAKGEKCIILTGDRDSLQLIDDNVTVRLATTRETIIFDRAKFFEVYGLSPKQLIDIKALMGDSSDNIPGVAGVGEKTALTLIKRHGSIEALFDALPTDGEIKGALRTKLENGRPAAEESKWLATIVTDAPIERNDFSPAPADNAALKATLTELEMFTLMEKLDSAGLTDLSSEASPPAKSESAAAYTVGELAAADIAGEFSFILSGEALYCAYGDLLCRFTSEEDILRLLTSEHKKRTFGAKPAYRYCMERGRELKNIISDADIAGYLLNASASEYTVKGLCGSYGCHDYQELGEYADIAALTELSRRLDAEVDELSMGALYRDTELPLTEVLASMEHDGVGVDADGVREFGEKLKAEIAGLEEQIYSLAGKKFNIASPKQLGDILFVDLGLPAGKKNRKGYSTGAEILEKLIGRHPIIELILQYRTLTKLNSTYVDGLLKLIGGDGRVHSVFKQTETRTGRISSTEPNMQNIPVRKEIGRNMRRFFVAGEGRILLDADYSQIELRLLSHMSGDENMRRAFINGEDIHASTAARVFGLPQSMVTPSMRSAAKAVNFGIVYGIGAFSLSQDIGVSVAEADRYIKEYLSNYPKVDEFMKSTIEKACECGYVTTMFGRRRYLPELSSSNKNLQAFGRRAAMNAPIQGSAADIIKIAMVRVYRRLKSEGLEARLILQVHDELIVEAGERDADRAAAILGEEMRSAAEISVPLTADVNRGRSWYDAKG